MLSSATAQLEDCADILQVPDVDSVIRLLSAGLGLLEKKLSLDAKSHLNAVSICRQGGLTTNRRKEVHDTCGACTAISIALLPSVRRDVEVGFDILQFGLRAYSLLCSIANGFDDKRDTIIARFSLLAVQVAFLDSHHASDAYLMMIVADGTCSPVPPQPTSCLARIKLICCFRKFAFKMTRC